MTPVEKVSDGALYNIRDAINFVEHFDRQVEAMLAGAITCPQPYRDARGNCGR